MRALYFFRVARISIHALLAEGDGMISGRRITLISISIHALLAEGDTASPGRCDGPGHFNPRPPRGGRRLVFGIVFPSFLFQSTPSSRRATGALAGDVRALVFQSTPSSRRATIGELETALAEEISIHALLAEGDR